MTRDSGDDGDLLTLLSASRLPLLPALRAVFATAGTKSRRGWSASLSAAWSGDQCRCLRLPSAAGHKKARGYSLHPWRGLLRRRVLFLLAAPQNGGAVLQDR